MRNEPFQSQVCVSWLAATALLRAQSYLCVIRALNSQVGGDYGSESTDSAEEMATGGLASPAPGPTGLAVGALLAPRALDQGLLLSLVLDKVKMDLEKRWFSPHLIPLHTEHRTGGESCK